jgi:hypothetical protein
MDTIFLPALPLPALAITNLPSHGLQLRPHDEHEHGNR